MNIRNFLLNNVLFIWSSNQKLLFVNPMFQIAKEYFEILTAPKGTQRSCKGVNVMPAGILYA